MAGHTALAIRTDLFSRGLFLLTVAATVTVAAIVGSQWQL